MKPHTYERRQSASNTNPLNAKDVYIRPRTCDSATKDV